MVRHNFFLVLCMGILLQPFELCSMNTKQTVKRGMPVKTKIGQPKKKKKKSNLKKIAKKIYRSKLFWATVLVGGSAGTFVLLCQNQMVPGFEEFPTDWSEFKDSCNILFNGIEADVEINETKSEKIDKKESEKKHQEIINAHKDWKKVSEGDLNTIKDTSGINGQKEGVDKPKTETSVQGYDFNQFINGILKTGLIVAQAGLVVSLVKCLVSLRQ